MDLPIPGKGTYALILGLNHGKRMEIGRLGTFDFPVGFYAYAGSALGPGGLTARLKHHMEKCPNFSQFTANVHKMFPDDGPIRRIPLSG